MKIKVEIKNKILGNSIFWEGDKEDIDQIKNIVARNMAHNVACDGQARATGMWRVSKGVENDD